MNKNKAAKVRKRTFGTTMGVTSIIAILVILVLVVFSALSLITAKADLNLSQKTADNIKAYYIADGEAEQILAEASQAISSQNNGAATSNKDPGNIKRYVHKNNYKYEKKGNTYYVKFTVPIDSSRNLKAEVRIDNKGDIIKKDLWQVVPAKDWQEDNEIKLFM